MLLPVGGMGLAPLGVEVRDPARAVDQHLERRPLRPGRHRRLLAQRLEPVAQHRMGVFQIADAAHRLAQRLARELRPRRRRDAFAQPREGPRRQRLALGPGPVPGPELVGVPVGLDRDLGQRRGRHRGAEQPARDAVGLVLVLPREREGLGREAREIPAEEGLRDDRHHAFVALQVGVELEPRQPRAVDPGAELAVVAAQVAVLVREHRQQPPPVQHHQQRQPDAQRIDRAAEEPEARHLADAGVEVVVEVDMVDRRPLDLAADAVERLEQLGRVLARELQAVWLVEAHPQRAHRGPQQAQAEQQQPAARDAEAPVAQRHGDPDDQPHRQPEAGQHPEIAQRRERRHAAAVARAVLRAGMLAQPDEMDKISAIHSGTSAGPGMPAGGPDS